VSGRPTATGHSTGRDTTQTLPVGLVLLAGRFSTGSLTTIAAGITMAVVPVLLVFLALQRYIVQSISQGDQGTLMSDPPGEVQR